LACPWVGHEEQQQSSSGWRKQRQADGKRLSLILNDCLEKRKERRDRSWSSPSVVGNDLGVMEILSCNATRDLFLQKCKEKQCEECGLFILEVMRLKEEGLFAGKMEEVVARNQLEGIYQEFIDEGAR